MVGTKTYKILTIKVQSEIKAFQKGRNNADEPAEITQSRWGNKANHPWTDGDGLWMLQELDLGEKLQKGREVNIPGAQNYSVMACSRSHHEDIS